jgi:hypothetical protein
MQRTLAVTDRVDVVALELEGSLDGATDAGIVVHHQDSHTAQCGNAM